MYQKSLTAPSNISTLIKYVLKVAFIESVSYLSQFILHKLNTVSTV